MAEGFTFDARQYFDFSQDAEDLLGDSYFEKVEEGTPNSNECRKSASDKEPVEGEKSDTESDHFFSPMDETKHFSPITENNKGTSQIQEVHNFPVLVRHKLRKSLSLNHLPCDDSEEQKGLCNGLAELSLEELPRPSSACSLGHKPSRVASQEHINRLAQPKRSSSHDNLKYSNAMTLAEAVVKFQAGTPKRFRSKAPPKVKAAPFAWGGTKAQSPHLLTTKRARPVVGITKEEQELKEIEEARKFKIKAHPVNQKVLRGPLKTQVDKKPPTMIEPFNLTQVRKKSEPETEEKAPIFKAQPLPKSLHIPFKVHQATQPLTKAQTPRFSKRLSRTTPNKEVEKPESQEAAKPFKPSRTQPKPFSFEKRDQQLLKKKEEFINRVFEEEKKAREFHANPPPKLILRSRNNSQDHISEVGSSKAFKRSTEDLNTTVFKARPATVLAIKPFEPKKDENHVVKVEPFQLMTDQRLEERHKFDEKLKEKEEQIAANKRKLEEEMKKLHEEEVARIRKQAEYKAQPIKKYKEIIIQPSNKLTEPISPKFHTDRIRNKENIQQ